MKAEYWLERWQAGHIGFHRADANPRLVQHQRVLNDAVRVLVPLCGKSFDLEWLAVHGLEVVGIELSDLAAQAFFSERGFTPERRQLGRFVEYSHGPVAILVGDFFDANPETLGYFDAAYDRAAMIALPKELRARYAKQLTSLMAPRGRLLLLTLYFDAEGGPPFSVPPDEVRESYASARVDELSSDDARADAPGPVQRGASFVLENAYAIQFADDQ